MRFPSIKAVAAELRDANARVDRKDIEQARKLNPDDSGLDVRLQVYPDGSWALRTGDSSYDQDHRGYWGSGTLDGKRFDSEGMAKELLEQCKEQHATDQPEECKHPSLGVCDKKPAGLGYMQGRKGL